MGNVIRLGDKVDCGDFVAQGSSNVFVDGMPVTHSNKKRTVGHGCFPPTELTGPWASTVFVNNNPVGLKGMKIIPHRCGRRSHEGRVITSSSTVSIEG